jgi:hypothetical protein
MSRFPLREVQRAIQSRAGVVAALFYLTGAVEAEGEAAGRRHDRLSRRQPAQRLAIRSLTIDGKYGVYFGAQQVARIYLTNRQGVGHVSEQVSVMSSD